MASDSGNKCVQYEKIICDLKNVLDKQYDTCQAEKQVKKAANTTVNTTVANTPSNEQGNETVEKMHKLKTH